MIKTIPFHTDLLDEGGNATHVLIYGLLEILSYKEGYCWASNQTIADEVRLSKGRVANALSEMAGMGWIRVEVDENNHRTGIFPMWHLSKDPYQKQQGGHNKSVNPPFTNLGTYNTSNTIQEYTIEPKGSIAEKPQKYGNSQINELFDEWERRCGFRIDTKVKQNRYACQRLIKSRGFEQVMKVIPIVAETHSDQYAPGISNFMDLAEKWNGLAIWYKKKMAERQKRSVMVV